MFQFIYALKNISPFYTVEMVENLVLNERQVEMTVEEPLSILGLMTKPMPRGVHNGYEFVKL